jgi:hypothetical protein
MKQTGIMKKLNLNKTLAAGLALAGITLASSASAQTELLIGGGNATQTLLYDRVTNLFGAGNYTLTTKSTTPPVSAYTGTIPSLPGLGTVTIDFSLLGAVQGLQDLASQTDETTATGNQYPPALVVSSSSPVAGAVDPSLLNGTTTLEVPYAYIKYPANAPDLGNVTNLTVRQANYFEGANGPYFPSILLGGAGTSDAVYFVGRNTASAVRTEIDANIYYTTPTIATWTNVGANGADIIPDTSGGQSSGSSVRTLLTLIPNAIGEVAFSDIKSGYTPLNFEGVAPTIANVQNGSYPLWYYEHWYTNNSVALSGNQYTLINALISAYTNTTYQASNPNFVGIYVPLSGFNFTRPTDGGPISSTLY